MKRAISAVLLSIAMLFVTIQPASAASTPSLQQRNNTASQIWSTCIAPYQSVWNDGRVPSDVRDAAFNIGFYTCSGKTYNYTSRYSDMWNTTARMMVTNRTYYGKMCNSVAKVGTRLYAELVKKGLNPVGFGTWMSIIKGRI